jgi:hypothetical protein
MKASTEQLLLAIGQSITAHCERRSDLPSWIVAKLAQIRSDIQYLKEMDSE